MKTVALIVAAGTGSRFGAGLPKQYVELSGKPVLAHSLAIFDQCSLIDETILIVSNDMLDYAREHVVERCGISKVRHIIAGGATRDQSVRNGLKATPADATFVAIHDGARPLLTQADLETVLHSAYKDGAAILTKPVVETVKVMSTSESLATFPREKLYLALTPQVFAVNIIKSAYEKLADGACVTDDAQVVELAGGAVALTTASQANNKITTESDLLLAELILAARDQGKAL